MFREKNLGCPFIYNFPENCITSPFLMAYHFLERSPCGYQLQKRYDDDKTVRHHRVENQATRFPVRLPRPRGGQEAFADVKNYFA
jgi:hypothetical protein